MKQERKCYSKLQHLHVFSKENCAQGHALYMPRMHKGCHQPHTGMASAGRGPSLDSRFRPLLTPVSPTELAKDGRLALPS